MSMETPGEKNSQNAGATVLLVEDNVYTRGILRIALTQNGYRVLDAEDGVVAEKILTGTEHVGTIDCIVLDRLMPHMGGDELLARIKQNPSIAGIPIIILSDLESDEGVAKDRRLGAATYLVKVRNIPYGVVEKVKQLVAESRPSDHSHNTASPPPTLSK
ncbi:MAG: response regulator [bacterium]|nr:response regulator [bacterium]MDZ4284320.1 response regulator [Patescibacteria group bacterium]